MENAKFTKQHKSTPSMGWLLLAGTGAFSHLEQDRKFYLLISQNEVFIKFSGHNAMCQAFLAPVAHNDLYLQFAQTPCAQLRHFRHRGIQ